MRDTSEAIVVLFHEESLLELSDYAIDLLLATTGLTEDVDLKVQIGARVIADLAAYVEVSEGLAGRKEE